MSDAPVAVYTEMKIEFLWVPLRTKYKVLSVQVPLKFNGIICKSEML